MYHKREIKLDNKNMFVVDAVLPENVIEEFYKMSLSLPYYRSERSNDTDMYPIFSTNFKTSQFETNTEVGQTARTLLNELMNGSNYKLKRAYINMCHFGDMEYPHTDCNVKDTDITVLYYVNREWDYTWGGETKFYEDHDTRVAVLPKPGRFVLFPGAIEHIGSLPMRTCSASRLTLALKYAEDKPE
ncbi:2OG-Fe(II) oxygenase [Pedobacter sp. AW31-3R]|uniref:2OG-Fe(II) oxygenase n=1 Tax=Pedobacter sp. AW31-3R TaxID=3445781 RepID=UPI003F9EF39C